MRFGHWSRSSDEKILALQLRARRPRLYIQIPGLFVQKGSIGADAVFERVRQEAQRAVERHDWAPAPRARVAMEMRFFSRHEQIPALHHLVKGYVDPLRGVAFRDDRQVAYLVAIAWKPPRKYSEKSKAHENHLSISVERFGDCVRRFDLYHAIKDNPDLRGSAGRWDEDEDAGYGFNVGEEPDERLFAFFDIPEEVRAQYRRLHLIDFQKGLLAGNRIDWRDRPGGPPAHLAAMGFPWRRQAHPLLFALDLRGLPGQGESEEFKRHVRERFHSLRERWGDRGRFVVPVELDVQVPEHRGKLTDLDNVMARYIAPAMADELLAPEGVLHGYRIYRVKPTSPDDRTIGVKVLAEGAIKRFEESMEKGLEAGREWARDA